MTFVGRWIWIVVATVAAYSCGSGPTTSGGDAGKVDGGGPPSISEYFPSTIGNTWSYTDNSDGTSRGHTWTITERSTDCFTVKEVSTYFVMNYENFSKACIDALGIVASVSINRPYDSNNGDTEIDTYTPPLLHLPVDLSSGQVVHRSSTIKHTNDNKDRSDSDTSRTVTYTITVNGNESVTVPAGTFLALKVTIVTDQQTNDVTWWVRNVGIVKNVQFPMANPSNIIWSSELTSFTVN